MRPLQARLVTLCQQVLALGVVLVVLTPASGVVSLDIVGERPGPARWTAAAGARRADVGDGPDHAGHPDRDRGAAHRRRGRLLRPARSYGRRRRHRRSRVTSTPQAVAGFAAIGVTWRHGEDLEEDQIALEVRTRTGDEWSDWEALEYHDEHGPDAGSAEAAASRPGTEPMFVGEVDDVQVKAATDGTALPDDLSLALVDPGSASRARSRRRRTAHDGSTSYDEDYAKQGSMTGSSGDGIDAAGATRRPARPPRQPTIFSRAQWGADESIRDKCALRYGTISGGFVHHTVNANDYTEDQVPAILRSIYAYHVKSRGWSDIGYNFLVDRFGRIWEGRYGGIDKPVVGAHTLNYNQYSFAMSAIGNYETAQPTDVMLRAYGQLFAWKLSLHGVNPASTSQKIGQRHLPGDQRPPRRRLDRVPGQVPLRPAPAHPAVRRAGRAGHAGRHADRGVGAEPPEQPRRVAVPRPRGPARRRRARPGDPHRWPHVVPAAHGGRQEGLGQALRGPGVARPHRRRRGRPRDRSTPPARRASGRARATASSARPPRSSRSPATRCSPRSATSTATAATTWSPASRAASPRSIGDRPRRLRPQGHPQGLRQLPADHRRRRRQQRRSRRPAAAHQEPPAPADRLRHRPLRARRRRSPGPGATTATSRVTSTATAVPTSSPAPTPAT